MREVRLCVYPRQDWKSLLLQTSRVAILTIPNASPWVPTGSNTLAGNQDGSLYPLSSIEGIL